jgi:hypothetical protein
MAGSGNVNVNGSGVTDGSGRGSVYVDGGGNVSVAGERRGGVCPVVRRRRQN